MAPARRFCTGLPGMVNVPSGVAVVDGSSPIAAVNQPAFLPAWYAAMSIAPLYFAGSVTVDEEVEGMPDDVLEGVLDEVVALTDEEDEAGAEVPGPD